MITDPDSPYILSEPNEVKRRLAMLTLPHIAPLIAYTHQITTKLGSNYEIPYFDPYDGGIEAKVLFLLEAPGRKAMGSNFISRNNPDPSARTMCTLLSQVELPRKATLLWNIVPWYIGNESSIRSATKSDISTALPFVQEMINLLPNLQAIVLMGRKAQSSKLQLTQLTSARLFESWHPSQQVMNRWPERRAELLETFRNVAAFLSNGA